MNFETLVGDHGRRPVVLTNSPIGLATRDNDGRLCNLSPDHPNARLIAAAPDLLDALKRARDTIRNWHGMNEPDDMADAMWQLYQSSPEMKTINAAIAKAEGGAQ
jgi:hypothetical protein